MSKQNPKVVTTNITKSEEDYSYNQEQLLSSVASNTPTLAPQLQQSTGHIISENPTAVTVDNLGNVDPSAITSTAMTSAHNQVSGVNESLELKKDLPDHLPSLEESAKAVKSTTALDETKE